jgi:ribosomal protein L5
VYVTSKVYLKHLGSHVHVEVKQQLIYLKSHTFFHHVVLLSHRYTKVLDDAVEELQAITGQKPLITKAKKSVATFRLTT